MKSPEQLAAEKLVADAQAALAAATAAQEAANAQAAAVAAGEKDPAESFRTTTERQLAECYSRIKTLEAGGAAGLDSQGNSLEGKIRTFESRIMATETNVAENTSANLKLADIMTAHANQIAALTARLTALEAAPKPGQ